MKQLFFLFLLCFCTIVAYGQSKKLPKSELMSRAKKAANAYVLSVMDEKIYSKYFEYRVGSLLVFSSFLNFNIFKPFFAELIYIVIVQSYDIL